MIIISVAIGALGLTCLLLKRSLVGIFIGLQLLILGATSAFVLAGVLSGKPEEGHLFGFFIMLQGVGQLIVGYGLAVRLFYLKRQVQMDSLRSLKN